MKSDLVLTLLWCLVIAAAAAYDLKYRKIPNALSVLTWILGGARLGLLMGSAAVLSGLLAFLSTFFVGVMLVQLRVFGAGDIKLLMGVALGIGIEAWPEVALIILSFGAVFAVLKLLFQGALLGFIQRAALVFQEAFQRSPQGRRLNSLDLINQSDRFPFGVCILGGVLWHILA